MKCGSVCLTQFPFTNGTSAKMRPVLVVSKDEFNAGDDVVVVPISSKPLQDDQYSVFIDSSSPCFPATGLRIASAVKYTKLITLAKSVIVRRLGVVDATVLLDIQQKVAKMFV